MPPVTEDLLTLRDWLRYAVSRFNAADLVYGHGTGSALDEAAFLILSALHLPIDALEPWLEARLTGAERQKLYDLVEARVTTRKPAPYLVNAAWIRGHHFYVDERVIVPRSFIGEMLCELVEPTTELPSLTVLPEDTGRVLDLCTGSGCLAILAALAFSDATIDAADISADALAVAERNVRDYGLQDRVRLVQSDLFSALKGERYDLILSNPPYVTRAAVDAFPPEYRAEPQLAHLGGEDGLDLVRTILAEAADHLSADGQLVVEIGRGRELLEAEYPRLPFLWLDTAESSGEVFQIGAGDLAGKKKRRKS